ncbi:MAG TPA: aminopeptidase [Candidatus Saccharimonadales bacterium]|nr:aminopeptidase [Candidatus Saccharimonadales bacterium]
MRQFLTGSKGGRLRFLLLSLLCLGLAGCQVFSFYRQAVTGEYQILAHQEPVQKLIDDPHTPVKLRNKLEEVLRIRRFAAAELKLPAERSYYKYVDLHRTYVVWNVNVAPVLSLEPKTWWFPIVGTASYRGYFEESGALRYAGKWPAKDWDVYVDGIETYSTLGWFHDPLLNTFLFEQESELAEIIFHELGHQRLFVYGDTDFNEAFATTVAAEGIRRWFVAAHNPKAYQQYQAGLAHQNDFVQLVMDCRAELTAVYDDTRLTDAAKLQRKREIIQQLRTKYAAAKKVWGVSGYDEWFAQPINNAKLNTVSAYYDLVPAFQSMLRAQDGDMEKFYGAVKRMAKLPLAQRHEALRQYLKPPKSN